MPIKPSDLIKEAGKAGGIVSVFSDKDLRAHIKNVQCLRHKCIIPGRQGFVMESNPMAKNFPDGLCREVGLRKWRYKKDAWGRRIAIEQDFYMPEISSAYARERIYAEVNPICQVCRRCAI